MTHFDRVNTDWTIIRSMFTSLLLFLRAFTRICALDNSVSAFGSKTANTDVHCTNQHSLPFSFQWLRCPRLAQKPPTQMFIARISIPSHSLSSCFQVFPSAQSRARGQSAISSGVSSTFGGSALSSSSNQ